MVTKKQHQNHAVIASSQNNNSQVMQVHKLISNLIIFASGVALGIVINLYQKPFSKPSFNNVIQFNYQMTPQTPNASTLAGIPSPPSPERVRTGLRDFVRPPNVRHDMTDEELVWRASVGPRAGLRGFPSEEIIAPKVAFLFLVRSDVNLAPFWDRFFKGHDGLFSVYVHSSPSFNASAVPPDSAFHGRWIPSKNVKWGDPNMVEAERRLLANALLDLANKHFVLLSEACIPIFNFSTVYEYLMGSKKSFVEAYDLPGPVGRGRYKPKMKPHIKLSQWRKGSQWFELERALALEVVSDRKYFKLFDRYCHHSCYSDEHYLPTYLSIKFWKRISNRTLTWVDWSRGGPHPTRFVRQSVTVELLRRLRRGSECEYNGKKTNVCHLFARKFMPNTLDRLLRFGPKLMQFN